RSRQEDRRTGGRGRPVPPAAALDGGGDKNARKPAEKYGPFRVVGLGDDEPLETPSARSNERVRKVSVAVPRAELFTLSAQLQAESVSTGERLLNVEFSGPVR